MKKRIILSFCLLLSFFIYFSSLIQPKAENEVTIFDNTTYKVTENLINQDLGYGITHIKDLAVSKTSYLNDYDSCGPKDTFVGQQVNVLTVPSNEAVRIVNWTYMTQDGWTKQTVRKLAQNFELHNPGWKVVAAVNGDFFDINGKQALPYSMNGYGVSNGEVYKPYGSASNVGFKNDGSSYPLVGGKVCTSDTLKLQVLDNLNNVIKEYDVEKTNESPTENNVGVWFSYYVMNDSVRDTITISSPSNNTYVALAPIRCLPMNSTTVYGKGTLEKTNTSVNLKIGQFAVETTNEEIIDYINNGYVIRVQQNIIGDYADCDNITGAGAQLLADGKEVDNGQKQDRHPRTVVGIKADGSVVLMTVDGRQFSQDMYGMNYAELSAALLNYGCVEAYNLDGGGSTTFITRNELGDFDVQNSPSDGGEREDSNALLVVVPEISLDINSVTDTSVSLSYTKSLDTTPKNITLSLNGETVFLTDDTITFNNLTPKTKYTLEYTYDIEYKNTILKDIKNTITFTTGKTAPIIKNYCYTETETDYIIHFNIIDPEKTTSACYIKFDKTTVDITAQDKYIEIPKDMVKDPTTFTLNGRYDLKANPNNTVKFTYPILPCQDHDIEYVLDGGQNNENNPNTYNSSSIPVKLEDPTKEGHIFDGWYMDSKYYRKVTEITDILQGDITLYAKWIEIPYTISFEFNGGETSEPFANQYLPSVGIAELPVPIKEGYIFEGWYKDSNFNEEVVNISVGHTGDITLYAKWKEIITYSITYVLNEGTNDLDNPTTYDITELPFYFFEPKKIGYNFVGWFLSENGNDKILELTDDSLGNITLYARWNIITYSISYNLDGGINNSENPIAYTVEDLPINLKNPTKEGYNFMGWYIDEEQISSIEGNINKDITLTAKWEQIPNEEPAKKGCGCGKSIYMFEVISTITLLAFVLRKRNK